MKASKVKRLENVQCRMGKKRPPCKEPEPTKTIVVEEIDGEIIISDLDLFFELAERTGGVITYDRKYND